MKTAKVIFSILVFLSLSVPALSAPKVVGQARELILKKDRIGAAQLLLEAAMKTSGPVKAEIVRELDRLSSVFLTEQGQKNYELAESMLYENQSGAEAKYEEALVQEPGNVQVLLGLVCSRLAANECTTANEALLEVDKINPLSLEKKIFRYKVDLCAKKQLLVVENDPGFKGDLKTALKLVQIENLYNMQKIKEALAHLKDIQTVNMPEVSYWQFKLHENEPSSAVEAAQKYVDACKSMTTSLRRQFKFEPRLCKKIEEAEDYVSKNEEKK